jgi:hypothetical protein
MISLSLTSNTLRVTLSVPPIQTLLPWREEPLAFFAAREEEGVVIDYSLCSYLLGWRRNTHAVNAPGSMIDI